MASINPRVICPFPPRKFSPAVAAYGFEGVRCLQAFTSSPPGLDWMCCPLPLLGTMGPSEPGRRSRDPDADPKRPGPWPSLTVTLYHRSGRAGWVCFNVRGGYVSEGSGSSSRSRAFMDVASEQQTLPKIALGKYYNSNISFWFAVTQYALISDKHSPHFK